MVNFGATAEAVEQIPKYPDLGVGLHITLTGGKPVLPLKRVSSLVDSRGQFCRKPEEFGRLDPGEVRLEIEAQLDRFRELTGQLPTHFDSHHHAHRVPIVCEAVCTLARKMNLPIRNASPAVQLQTLNFDIQSTDYFVEDFFGDDVGVASLLNILRGLTPGSTELMCHPAYVDDELRANSGYVAERELELAALIDSAGSRYCDEEKIEFVHFGSL